MGFHMIAVTLLGAVVVTAVNPPARTDLREVVTPGATECDRTVHQYDHNGHRFSGSCEFLCDNCGRWQNNPTPAYAIVNRRGSRTGKYCCRELDCIENSKWVHNYINDGGEKPFNSYCHPVPAKYDS